MEEDFIDFLQQVCHIDVTKIPDIDALLDQCEYPLHRYVKWGSTDAEKNLMTVVSHNLIGMDWPTHGQPDTEFNQRMGYYFNEEDEE